MLEGNGEELAYEPFQRYTMSQYMDIGFLKQQEWYDGKIGADTDEKMDRYIRTIYTKACDMDNLINELTFYAKVDSDKINYNFIKFNLTEYFNDCIDEIGVDLESRNIELKYINELDKETAIVADPEQFKRVINNIINNSMKYMEINNGVVEVHLYNEGDDVHIDISDNGKGISQKDIGHIFDRFYRSDTSRNSRTRSLKTM